MKNYSEKYEYLYNRQGGMCAICRLKDKLKKDIYEKDIHISANIFRGIIMFGFIMSDLHHRLHSTKANRKKYPLFIDSMLNLVGVSNGLHLQHPSCFKITDLKAERYERFLKKHPKINNFVNGGF